MIPITELLMEFNYLFVALAGMIVGAVITYIQQLNLGKKERQFQIKKEEYLESKKLYGCILTEIMNLDITLNNLELGASIGDGANKGGHNKSIEDRLDIIINQTILFLDDSQDNSKEEILYEYIGAFRGLWEFYFGFISTETIILGNKEQSEISKTLKIEYDSKRKNYIELLKNHLSALKTNIL